MCLKLMAVVVLVRSKSHCKYHCSLARVTFHLRLNRLENSGNAAFLCKKVAGDRTCQATGFADVLRRMLSQNRQRRRWWWRGGVGAGVGAGAQEENSEKSTVNAQEKGERDDRGVQELMFYLKIKHFEY